jgi:hypothetical protein
LLKTPHDRKNFSTLLASLAGLSAQPATAANHAGLFGLDQARVQKFVQGKKAELNHDDDGVFVECRPATTDRRAADRRFGV